MRPFHVLTRSGRDRGRLLVAFRPDCADDSAASRSTDEIYVNWIQRFILFHGKRHPLEMGNAEVTAFLTHLAVEEKVAASTQNQALSALLLLYREVLDQQFGWLDDVVRVKKGKRLPVVFSPEEAVAVIEHLQGSRL